MKTICSKCSNYEVSLDGTHESCYVAKSMPILNITSYFKDRMEGKEKRCVYLEKIKTKTSIKKKPKIKDPIYDLVHSYKTKYEQGFTNDEMAEILKGFPKINMKKFNEAMFGNTCMVIDEKIITYHCDLVKALYCGIENRDLKPYEFD